MVNAFTDNGAWDEALARLAVLSERELEVAGQRSSHEVLARPSGRPSHTGRGET